MANELVFIGLSRQGLEEAQRDRDRHAEILSRRIRRTPQNPDLSVNVKAAMQCDRQWPTCEVTP